MIFSVFTYIFCILLANRFLPRIVWIVSGVIGLGLLLFYLYHLKKPLSSDEIAKQTIHNPTSERFKFLRRNWGLILICILYVLVLLWNYNYFPLKYQPKLFYVHGDKADTYPKLGLIISLQSVKTFGTKDEIGARGFRLVTYDQDPNQNSQIRKKHVKVTEKESVEVGDYWDFQIDDIWYRIVFKCYVYKDGRDCAAFELSLLGRKKD